MKYVWYALLILLTCSFGCESSSKYSLDNDFVIAEEIDLPVSQANYQSNKSTPSIQPKHLIKNATLDIYVSNLDSAFNSLESIIELNGGYIGQLELVNNEYETINNIEIRVPSINLESSLNEIESLATKVRNKEIKTKDVGEEYIDVTTRLATQEEVRDRYVDVLRNKAKTVEDILKTERQLGQIQEDIEAMKGRLKYLDNRINLSTIKVTLRNEVPAVAKVSKASLFVKRASNGFGNGWQGILEIVLILINLWPLALVLATILIFRKRIFAIGDRKVQ